MVRRSTSRCQQTPRWRLAIWRSLPNTIGCQSIFGGNRSDWGNSAHRRLRPVGHRRQAAEILGAAGDDDGLVLDAVVGHWRFASPDGAATPCGRFLERTISSGLADRATNSDLTCQKLRTIGADSGPYRSFPHLRPRRRMFELHAERPRAGVPRSSVSSGGGGAGATRRRTAAASHDAARYRRPMTARRSTNGACASSPMSRMPKRAVPSGRRPNHRAGSGSTCPEDQKHDHRAGAAGFPRSPSADRRSISASPTVPST